MGYGVLSGARAEGTNGSRPPRRSVGLDIERGVEERESLKGMAGAPESLSSGCGECAPESGGIGICGGTEGESLGEANRERSMNMRVALTAFFVAVLFAPACMQGGDSGGGSGTDAGSDAGGDAASERADADGGTSGPSDSSSGSTAPSCAELVDAICEKSSGCADSTGEFVLALGDRATVTYESKSQCRAASPINEDNCMSAGESARSGCSSAVESATCDGNELKLTEACIFDGE